MNTGYFAYTHLTQLGSLNGRMPADQAAKAIRLIKEYLISRAPQDGEPRTMPQIPANPTFYAIDLGGFDMREIRTNPAHLKQGLERHYKTQEGVAERIAQIPTQPPYQGMFNITRGHRPANIADIALSAASKKEIEINITFINNTGDDTRPLFFMQYDALLKKAQAAGIPINRNALDCRIEAFRSEDTYFRRNPSEAMSSFAPSELKLALDFLWPHEHSIDKK